MIKNFISITLLCVICMGSFAKKSNKFIGAESNKVATRWQEAMITGNGVMGAMMYGKPDKEIIVVNHCEMFLPLGTKEFVPDLSAAMPEIKEAALKAGKNGPAVAHKLMVEKANKKISWTDPFHPAFSFHIDRIGDHGEVKNYKCTENFASGELKVSWDDDMGHWERKLFISRPDNVLALEISGPRGKVSGDYYMQMTHELIDVDMIAGGSEIKAHVTYVKGKGGYDNLVRFYPVGGTIESDNNKITILNADKVLILMQVEPWRAPLPESQSEAWAFSPRHPDFVNGYPDNKLEAMAKGFDNLDADYQRLFKPHKEIHEELFGRVKLTLADNKSTSQELLENAVGNEKLDLELVQKLYDACRYLTICSTGKNPPNLQGIWTGSWNPEWSGDYTLDSNIQLAIQSIMSCNMPELMEAYFSTIESWVEDFRTNARKMFGCRGIVSNPKASNTPLYLHWGRWPGDQAIGTMGWMLHFFYDYYRFTGDKVFLKNRVVPLLKESALFYEDFLKGTEDKNGKYTFYISYSPEQDHKLYANSTFDIAVAKSVLSNLVDACKILNIEQENIARWEQMLDKMPEYLINEKGELQEWAYEGTTENFNHRHHSHLLALYQFCEFDKNNDPILWKASGKAFEGKEREFLNNWKNPDSNHITHGIINQAQCAARLGRSDVVHEVLSRLVRRKYVYPSFMISYWPNNQAYGFDPVGTIPDVINNSLAFAWDGKLDLLPALPKEWDKGAIENILLRGQMQLQKLEWNLESGSVNLKINSKIDQEIELRLPEDIELKSIKVNGRQYSSLDSKCIRIKLRGE